MGKSVPTLTSKEATACNLLTSTHRDAHERENRTRPPKVTQLAGRSSTSADGHPDKKKLFSVQDFFRYAEVEGCAVIRNPCCAAVRKRFFEELDRDGDGQVTLEDLEDAMRRRRLPRRNQILTSLKRAGLPANEDNAAAMLRYLNTDSEGSISYCQFRNFMLLLPSERLEDVPRNIWFEAATVVAIPRL